MSQCLHPERVEGLCTACGDCLHEVILNGRCYACDSDELDGLALSPKPADQLVPLDRLRKPR